MNIFVEIFHIFLVEFLNFWIFEFYFFNGRNIIKYHKILFNKSSSTHNQHIFLKDQKSITITIYFSRKHFIRKMQKYHVFNSQQILFQINKYHNYSIIGNCKKNNTKINKEKNSIESASAKTIPQHQISWVKVNFLISNL